MLNVLKISVYNQISVIAKYLLGGILLVSFFLVSCGKKSTGAFVAMELAGKTHIMKQGEYEEIKLQNADYYLLYFTASW